MFVLHTVVCAQFVLGGSSIPLNDQILHVFVSFHVECSDILISE